jgi:hypothetical protein
MTLNKAFEQLIAIRGWYKLCGITPDAARACKKRYKKGELPPGRVYELIELAGYKISVSG